MSQVKTEKSDPVWVKEAEGLEPEFYDATGELTGESIELPYIEEAEYVTMDSTEALGQNALATDGIFHCVGIIAEGEETYLGHATPGSIRKTAEETLYEVEKDVENVTYALGGSPDLELLEEVRNQFTGSETIIYTGTEGSIAVDEKGNMYRFEREEKNPLSTTR